MEHWATTKWEYVMRINTEDVMGDGLSHLHFSMLGADIGFIDNSLIGRGVA